MTDPAQDPFPQRLVRPHANYRELRPFQVSEVIYDATVKFCDRFIEPRSRLREQMVQAARSGRQNIAEGTLAGAVSRKMEIKLVGIARASLEELLLDYEDFLRQRGFQLWPKDHLTIQTVRRLAYGGDRSYSAYAGYIERASAEVAANTIQCLIHQANFLLERYLAELEQDFMQYGGFTEGLYRARQQARRQKGRSGTTNGHSNR